MRREPPCPAPNQACDGGWSGEKPPCHAGKCQVCSTFSGHPSIGGPCTSAYARASAGARTYPPSSWPPNRTHAATSCPHHGTLKHERTHEAGSGDFTRRGSLRSFPRVQGPIPNATASPSSLRQSKGFHPVTVRHPLACSPRSDSPVHHAARNAYSLSYQPART